MWFHLLCFQACNVLHVANLGWQDKLHQQSTLQVQTLEYLCLSKFFYMVSLEEISDFETLGKMCEILYHTNFLLYSIFHCEINNINHLHMWYEFYTSAEGQLSETYWTLAKPSSH